MSKLIVGCGYLGQRVARRWLAAGQTVFAVTRRRKRAEQFEREGIQPIIADVTSPTTLAGLPPTETVLYSVGYDRHGGNSRWEVYVEGLRAVLNALPPATARLIFTSSTGVYGQTDGSWVDENSPCRPTREAGRAFLAAERLLADHSLGRRAIILRSAGLYGPGRIPRRADILAGKPIPAPLQGHLNLIHVDDAAAVVLAAEARARPPRTYVVSDGHPIGRRAYYVRVAELLGAPQPRFLEPPPESPAAVRATADKRANNARLLAELRISLTYPSFDHFLASLRASSAGWG